MLGLSLLHDWNFHLPPPPPVTTPPSAASTPVQSRNQESTLAEPTQPSTKVGIGLFGLGSKGKSPSPTSSSMLTAHGEPATAQGPSILDSFFSPHSASPASPASPTASGRSRKSSSASDTAGGVRGLPALNGPSVPQVLAAPSFASKSDVGQRKSPSTAVESVAALDSTAPRAQEPEAKTESPTENKEAHAPSSKRLPNLMQQTTTDTQSQANQAFDFSAFGF